MFVEALTLERINKFVQENLSDDVYPQLTLIQTTFLHLGKNPVWEILYCSKSMNKPHIIYLMDNRVTPMIGIGEEFEEKWIKFLYSMFGEEYRKWFMKQKNKIFE